MTISPDPFVQFDLLKPADTSATPLPSSPPGPFWLVTPFATSADYADGLEDLITDYNQQEPNQLAAWAQRHPLTKEQRFILEYNTSPDRANVLRSLPLVSTDRVLEVGSGCGPVSQYLWSRAQTLSIEASVSRAQAAASLLRKHVNPYHSALLSTDFYLLDGSPNFDWVIFNGVLEYAAIYAGSQEASPYVTMLKKAFRLLKPGGRCVVTIENRLGLKYFAGAPEDHFGQTSVGLEGYRTLDKKRPAIRTFSRPQITRLFNEAGYPDTHFQYPFPDYKFTKVIVPDDRPNWRFAADRLIDNSPAWRSPRDHHFDEPSVFRSLADEGTAGDFANSFLIVSPKPGARDAKMATDQIHYFPLRRKPSQTIGAVFFPEQGLVQRKFLSGKKFKPETLLPAHAPGNPKAEFIAPIITADCESTTQEISSCPTLWESLRHSIGAATNSAAEYEKLLGQTLRHNYGLYQDCLPFASQGSWERFMEKLKSQFSLNGLLTYAAGVLSFVEKQESFAMASLNKIQTKPWCLWAPDWIMENLIPSPDGTKVRLFDVEYVAADSCLPTPVLAYRQLRMLQTHISHPSLATHWPWASHQLQLRDISVDLPAPAANWAAETLWESMAPEEASRCAWFWTKIAEIVECAMISTVVTPFTRVYETIPWLQRLSAELDPLPPQILSDETIQNIVLGLNDTSKAAPADQSNELISKEQKILELIEDATTHRTELNREITQLHATAAERLTLIQKLDTALRQTKRSLTEFTQDPIKGSPDLPALADEVIDLRCQLDVTRRQLQHKHNRLSKLEHAEKLRSRKAATSFAQRMLNNWQGRLADVTPFPLGKLQQYQPRTQQLEKFPRKASPSTWPRICLATPSYQQGQFLERTMLSVLDQNYPNLAYGVQDGGSTDESTTIINRHISRLSHAESAPDKGQSDAIRRGFAQLHPTSDDIMGWLNSDDILMPGTLHFVGNYFARHPEVDVIYGHRVIIDEQDREIGRWFLPRYHSDTLKWFDLVPQETMFWRARHYQEIGGLDDSFQFALDWDLLLRFEEAGCNIRRLPYFLGCFRSHGEQKTSAKIQSVGENEMTQLRRRTHERQVPPKEILKHLNDEINRSAMIEWLHRHGMRY